MKKISILGVTGSIGTQTLEVLRYHKDKFELLGISAHKNINLTLEVIKEFKPKVVAITHEESYKKLKKILLKESIECDLILGIEGLNKVATIDEVDIVVTSVVGMIGLEPTIKAIEAKKSIALANKETLVVAGELVMKKARENSVKILPVDSEHSAIFQCLQGNSHNKIDKILLTASGGPFRGKSLEYLKGVNIKDALNHPNWSMGKKITIDSSTLMNKGLEVIEAHWLFACPYDDIEVLVHPQSIIHSMVQYTDGAVMAQLGVPNMKLPIQYAINYPRREGNVEKKLNFSEISTLTFEKPDMDVFKCLKLAYKAGRTGYLMPTILNAANEVLVELFLDEKVSYLDIGNIIEETMNIFEYKDEVTLDNVINKDKEVREYIYKKYSI